MRILYGCAVETVPGTLPDGQIAARITDPFDRFTKETLCKNEADLQQQVNDFAREAEKRYKQGITDLVNSPAGQATRKILGLCE